MKVVLGVKVGLIGASFQSVISGSVAPQSISGNANDILSGMVDESDRLICLVKDLLSIAHADAGQ